MNAVCPLSVPVVACLVTLSLATQAQPAAKLLPFQGRLTASDGNPVADGARLIQFRLYDQPVDGAVAWAGEVHRATVNGGVVNVMLGSEASLANVDFDRVLYLEITVDANGDDALNAADPPLLPRQVLLPVVFAKEAGVARAARDRAITAAMIADGAIADRHVGTLSHLSAADASPSHALVVNATGDVGIGTGGPRTRVDVQGGQLWVSDAASDDADAKAYVQGRADAAYFGAVGNQRVSFGNQENPATLTLDGGQVGIGTTTPSATLEVQGVVKATEFVGDGGKLTGLTGQPELKARIADLQRQIDELRASGGTAPLVFDVGHSDLTTWVSVGKDLSDYLDDDDGCSIRVIMTHEQTDETRTIVELLAVERSALSNDRSAGRHGWTRQDDGDFLWVLGNGTRYKLFDAWGWGFAHNYKHEYANQGVKGPAEAGFTVWFMVHPHVRAHIIVYDH